MSLTLDSASGGTAFFTAKASDPDRNLSEIEFDYGDGARETITAGQPLPGSHAYAAPGTYRITATARDFYGKRRIASVTATV
jgi:PKD repeat protein